MTLAEIQALCEYHYWAKGRVLQVVDSLSQEQLLKDLGSSHGGIHGTLIHIIFAEYVWLACLTDQPFPSPIDSRKYSDVNSIRKIWDEVEQRMNKFISGLSDVKLSSMVTYKKSTGIEYSHPVWQVLQHLVNHSSYHRGQIVTMLRQLGVKPVGTDLIMYYREQQ